LGISEGNDKAAGDTRVEGDERGVRRVVEDGQSVVHNIGRGPRRTTPWAAHATRRLDARLEAFGHAEHARGSPRESSTDPPPRGRERRDIRVRGGQLNRLPRLRGAGTLGTAWCRCAVCLLCRAMLCSWCVQLVEASNPAGEQRRMAWTGSRHAGSAAWSRGVCKDLVDCASACLCTGASARADALPKPVAEGGDQAPLPSARVCSRVAADCSSGCGQHADCAGRAAEPAAVET